METAHGVFGQQPMKRTLETDGKNNKQETAGHWRKSALFQRESVQTVSDRLQCSEFMSIER